MKTLKNYILKYASVLASIALAIGVTSSTQACWLMFNQPKEPQGLAKFAKEEQGKEVRCDNKHTEQVMVFHPLWKRTNQKN